MRPALWTILLLIFMTVPCAVGQDRFSVGTQYTYFHNQHGYWRNDSLIGARGDVRALKWVWITGQLDTGLAFHSPPRVSSIDGGRIVLGRFGTKIGRQGKRIGTFADIRGGFVSWSDALVFWDFSPVTGGIRYGRFTVPILNLGATAEIYTSRKTGIRFSLGNSMAFHGHRQVVSIEPAFPGYIAHNVDFSTGFFVRF